MTLRRVYKTDLGSAWECDSLDFFEHVPDNSVNLILTSPPFALTRKKSYGNPPAHEYIDWFLRFAKEFRRVLQPDGSLVIEIGGAWNPGVPTRSIYQFKLLNALVGEGEFHLAQEFYWYNKAKLPGPVQWVNVERIRVKDSVSPIWWLSKTERPKANNRNVLKPYSESQKRLFEKGYNDGERPSGWTIGEDSFSKDNGGAIPPNVIEASNTTSVDGYQDYCREYGFTTHPARFPRDVPDFFVKFLTERDDLVIDPFGGSNMTGAVAEHHGRKWFSCERELEFVQGSVGRFLESDGLSVHRPPKVAKPFI